MLIFAKLIKLSDVRLIQGNLVHTDTCYLSSVTRDVSSVICLLSFILYHKIVESQRILHTIYIYYERCWSTGFATHFIATVNGGIYIDVDYGTRKTM